VNGARDAIANSDLHSARLDIQSALTAAENNTVIGTGQPNANP